MLLVRKLWVEKLTEESKPVNVPFWKSWKTSLPPFDFSIFSQRVQEQESTSPVKFPSIPQREHQEPEFHPRSFLERAAQAIKNVLDFRKKAARSLSNFVPQRKATRPLPLKLMSRKQISSGHTPINKPERPLVKKIECNLLAANSAIRHGDLKVSSKSL